MAKEHRYDVLIVRLNGTAVPIVEGERSIMRARSVAKGVKEKPNRRIRILRDGKELSGGASALDREVYELWLDARKPEKT